MRSVMLKATVLAFAMCVGLAFAQYNPDDDVYVTVDTPLTTQLAETAGVGVLGSALFDAQEGVHETVKRTTGVQVKHHYINICFGPFCIPIDPIKFGR